MVAFRVAGLAAPVFQDRKATARPWNQVVGGKQAWAWIGQLWFCP